MREKHNLSLLREALILYKGRPTNIEVWKCRVCQKYYIIDAKKHCKIFLNNELGEEIV